MERIEKIISSFNERGLDGILITSPYNRRYASNFTGTAGSVLISQEKSVFITDFRYVEQAEKQCKGYEIVQQKKSMKEEIANQVEKLGIKKLGFEQDYVTFAQYKEFESAFETELIPVSGIIEKLRLIKTESEIKILKEAAEIADAAFEHIITFIQPGITELEVSNELEFFMRKAGATSSSFDTIVASGIRSALPHGVATDKVIEKGDFVTLTMVLIIKVMSLILLVQLLLGNLVISLKKFMILFYEAQMRGVNGLKPGMSGKEADALTRDYITEKGYGEYFGHSTGHGIGLEVHEGPNLSLKSDMFLNQVWLSLLNQEFI